MPEEPRGPATSKKGPLPLLKVNELAIQCTLCLTDDPETCATKIGRMFRAGGPVAELLMHIEEDATVRVTVVEMLRVMG